MAPRTFSRNRIRGISFHRQRGISGVRSRKMEGHLGYGFPWTGPGIEDLRNSAPVSFNDRDLHRLLADQGRQEVHSLVSDAVDHLAQLRHLGQALQRFVTQDDVDRKFLDGDETESTQMHPAQELYVEVNRLQRLWKVRLEILEMVVMAQNSLRNYPTEFSKTPQRRVASFAPQKK